MAGWLFAIGAGTAALRRCHAGRASAFALLAGLAVAAGFLLGGALPAAIGSAAGMLALTLCWSGLVVIAAAVVVACRGGQRHVAGAPVTGQSLWFL